MVRLRMLVAVMVVGCGGGASSNVDANSASDPTPWVGNWTSAGTQSTTCGTANSTDQLSGLLVIAAGTKAGTIKTTSNNCTLIWDLDGTKAALEAGQVCTVTVAGLNVTVTWTQSSATLNTTTITGTNTGSTNNGCSFMQQYTLTKS